MSRLGQYHPGRLVLTPLTPPSLINLKIDSRYSLILPDIPDSTRNHDIWITRWRSITLCSVEVGRALIIIIKISCSFVIILFTFSLVSFPYLIVSSHPTSCRLLQGTPGQLATHRLGVTVLLALGTIMVLLLELYPWLSH